MRAHLLDDAILRAGVNRIGPQDHTRSGRVVIDKNDGARNVSDIGDGVAVLESFRAASGSIGTVEAVRNITQDLS